jgi:hypothetical protein
MKMIYVLHVYHPEKGESSSLGSIQVAVESLTIDYCDEGIEREMVRLGAALFPFLQSALRDFQLQSRFALRKVFLSPPFV